jgi:nicotinate phosphoribosyltransferase
VTSPALGLYTDLYELTMAASFHAEGRDDEVTFDLFVRALPLERAFLVVCGVDTAMERLAAFRFDAPALAYLESLALFDAAFLDRLAHFRFDGEVRSMAEGELAFAGEPILTVTAPIIEAQLVETLLINTVAFETMVASKAARVTLAAAGRPYVDFSARRDHGLDAALGAARAACVGGASGTSLVEAGRRFGLAVSGTMAHSYVMAHPDEVSAFRAYLRQYRERSVLLVDTYDTAEGTRRAVDAMKAEGVVASAIRIDSGDLGRLSVEARAVLDAAGLPAVKILASGDLDETRVATLVAAGARIDAFGVGTRLGTSADAPYLGMVYKLAEQGGEPRLKLSPGKQSLPGRKQVWRTPGRDTISLASEPGPAGGRPLLGPAPPGGSARPAEAVASARERCLAGLERWSGVAPVVEPSELLRALAVQAAGVAAAR